jgi:hypothetical protein
MVLKKRIEKVQVTLWVRARRLAAQINESLVMSKDTVEFNRIKALEQQLDTVRKRLAKVESIAHSRLDRKNLISQSDLTKIVLPTSSTMTDGVAVTAP